MTTSPSDGDVMHDAPAIEATALALARQFNIYSDQGVADVKRLVTGLGGEIAITFDTPDSRESMKVRRDEATSRIRFKIFLPWNNSTVRDRFTIAHEIGHLKLHFDPEREVSKEFNRYGRSREETEANAFAAAILMPMDYFKDVFTKHNGDPVGIADHFLVSVSSARARAASLGLVG